MNNLIQFENILPVASDKEFPINARNLHKALRVSTPFDKWISRRLEESDAVEGKDFSTYLSKSTGGRPSKEYNLTLQLAKEISMLEKTPIGKLIRRYFISCEEQLKTHKLPLQANPLALAEAMLNSLKEQESRITTVESRLDNTPVEIDGEKAGHLHNILSFYGKRIGNYSHGYGKFKRHYGLGSYKQLPLRLYNEAIELVESWHIELNRNQKGLFE